MSGANTTRKLSEYFKQLLAEASDDHTMVKLLPKIGVFLLP
jgi:hypothetical protein